MTTAIWPITMTSSMRSLTVSPSGSSGSDSR
jgi:hypothetical protein